MTDPETHKKPLHKTRSKKTRRHVWFQATAQRDHVHLQANVPTKWFKTLRWVVLIIVIALIIRFLPDIWQAVQIALQTLPK
jgi:hypothetical protein